MHTGCRKRVINRYTCRIYVTNDTIVVEIPLIGNNCPIVPIHRITSIEGNRLTDFGVSWCKGKFRSRWTPSNGNLPRYCACITSIVRYFEGHEAAYIPLIKRVNHCSGGCSPLNIVLSIVIEIPRIGDNTSIWIARSIRSECHRLPNPWSLRGKREISDRWGVRHVNVMGGERGNPSLIGDCQSNSIRPHFSKDVRWILSSTSSSITKVPTP